MTTGDRNTVIFYRGPSQLTGDPIVGVLSGLTLDSENTKTGHMLQTWILRPDMTPTEAIASGQDRAICGDCRLRGDGIHGRGCYVTWWQAPKMIQQALHKRPYVDPWELRDQVRGEWIRVGAYGDPAALPLSVWAALLSRAGGWVGYTQQWKTCDPGFKFLVMASVHSPDEQAEAVVRGWRTYRVRQPDSPLAPGEIICPASDEAGHKLTCQRCGVCQGAGVARPNATILPHGKPGNMHAFGLRFHTEAGGLLGRPAAKTSPVGDRPMGRPKVGRPKGKQKHRPAHLGPEAGEARAILNLADAANKLIDPVHQAHVPISEAVLRSHDYAASSKITRVFLDRIKYGPRGKLE